MFRFAKTALNLSAQGARQAAWRQCHHKAGPDFHDKYGNILLVSGTLFCVAVWSYVATQTGITWNLSPVGKVTPKEWREE
ncbi:COX7B oxidase, partial [Atractosteus spatula]|uniref:Cytochrome c oxidase subunit 7B, mitochondrial n=2 Tax=Lepisosteidae TaxID=7915 RepID=W5N907_LEPOC|nr:PREDICTED: cytochrome c oxidase subunit 7B, mitochondrial [Lepisosteus oculatus]MBN3323637.1 COX7B oxidase [Atractosteus spatula]